MSNKMKTTGAMDESTPALVPKLRFPEFREAKSWDASTLGELSEVVRGGSPRPIDGFITTSADGLNWLKISDVDKDAKYVTHTAEKVRAEALSKTRVANPGDLILSNSMSFGRPYILQIATCIHDGWIAITKISKKTDRDFLYYLISAPGSQSYLVDNAAGSGVLNLNTDTIRALRVCFPSPPEQQKIAECLSSVDDLVAAQAQKLDALKTHKIGLMQQLFPREGETQPRVRFPEFQNAGEWMEKKLEDLAKRGSGHTPNKSYPEYYGGGIKWISPADSKRLDCGLISSTTIEISEKGIQNSSAVLHPKGTVIISRDAGVGKSAIMSIPMAVSQHFITWTCKSNLLSNWFLYHFLQNSKPLFERSATGSTIKTIGVQFFLDLVFHVPLLPEQQRIADCLNSLDALITAETQKLEALKNHKKGLMQILFPIPAKIES
ncbi:UNVERIFIED_ORG: type I restriction enzyme S subunit [Pseudomonas fluorescens]